MERNTVSSAFASRCQPLLQPQQWTIPAVSDEHRILHFGDPFEQNKTTKEQSPTDKPQLMDGLTLSANSHQEEDIEISPLHLFRLQAMKVPLTNEDIESLSSGQYQPAHTSMGRVDVHQSTPNPEAHQQEVLSTLSQGTVTMGINMELADMDLGTLLAYGDLGPISVDDISIQALSFSMDMEPFSNDTYRFGNALARDVKHQPNVSDPLNHLQIRETFSDSADEKVTNADGKGENVTCPTMSGSACEKSFGSVKSNSDRGVVRSDNSKHPFANYTGQKPFQCDMCPKQFLTSNKYEIHRRMHTGEKPFKCNFCRKEFSDPSSFRRHRRLHTGEKPFKCDFCQKYFSDSSNYQTHRRMHTGKKPFQCDMCPKRFLTSGNYQRHKRTHTGERPFQCDICLKQFCASSDYKTHRRIHTGERPFQCDLCLKQFRTSDSKQRHRRAHTGEKPFHATYARNSSALLAIFGDIDTYMPERNHSNVVFARKSSVIAPITRDIGEHI